MQFRFFLFFLFASPTTDAQDIRGNWKGKIYTQGSTDSLNFDLTIRSNKKKVLSGSTTVHFDNFSYATAVISVQYDSAAKTIYLMEKTIIDKNISDYIPLSLDEYYLNLETPRKLSGLVYCFKMFAARRGFGDPPCHGTMHIDLWKQ